MKLKDKHITVCIWSENYAKLAEWYEKVLEFPVRERLNFPDDTGVDFDFGTNFLYIGRHNKIKGKNKDPYRIMTGFGVESVSKTYEELKKKKVNILVKPFAAPPGGFWCITISDPEGNTLQFTGGK